jgi:hypothetical protein
MSTNAAIIVPVTNKATKEISFKGIYLHWDGYPSSAGEILSEHFKDKNKVNKLINLGNCSVLAPELDPNPELPHGFLPTKRQENVCLFYGRDRGETKQEAATGYSVGQIVSQFGSAEYYYVYDPTDKTWGAFENN